VITIYRKKAVTLIKKFKNSTLETMIVMKSSELKGLMILDLLIVNLISTKIKMVKNIQIIMKFLFNSKQKSIINSQMSKVERASKIMLILAA